jgi:hypothetical protein
VSVNVDEADLARITHRRPRVVRAALNELLLVSICIDSAVGHIATAPINSSLSGPPTR